jgi:branched-chain amino acid transport system permease protein
MAGALAGLAGALLANLNGLVSPHLMHWTQSGQLMVMVIIGGAGALWGGLLGAVGLLVLEEVLSGYTEHWHMPLGVVLLAVVLFAPKGPERSAQARLATREAQMHEPLLNRRIWSSASAALAPPTM